MTFDAQPWISVVIPMKDERENILPLSDQLLTFLRSREESQCAAFEIVFVDDGSTDHSARVFQDLMKEHAEVRVVSFDRNYGQTAAFDAGFRHAKGALIVTLDGDLQYDPVDIGRLLPLANHYDVVCGRRERRNDDVIRRWSSRLANSVRNAVIHDGIHDTGCSLKVFHRSVLDRIPLFKGMHRFFPALAQMYGFTVTEIPVQHFPRIHGQSKYGVGNRLFASLYDLFAVRWMQSRALNYTVKQSSRQDVSE
ncbi:MAG: glycosyltransferase family 2 protein [Nitrospirales bacterium]|nr:glycosyltransferase family 2 protein [Nitrospira sp.]MDR4501593.1 glycosyltransferase family 2 protein [Nitrospirales bacterium]